MDIFAPRPMKILALPRYGRTGASSRIRLYQFLPGLERRGFSVRTAPFFWEGYQELLHAGRRPSPGALAGAFARRLRVLRDGPDFDLLWLEYEVFPWLPAWAEGWLRHRRIPFVVDYDDAIFHRYDRHRSVLVRTLLGGKIDAVMRRASLVTAGNAYLAERAERAGARRVAVLPSVVDLERYRAAPAEAGGEPVTIGWIGAPSTARYLRLIEEALAEVCRRRPVRLVVVGSGTTDLGDLPAERVPWTEDSEAERLRSFDIGVMPLADAYWERGKCGFKLIQYMACGLPVVASPVGVNRTLVRPGENGFLAATQAEWVAALLALIDDPGLRRTCGRSGRRLVAEEYCLARAEPRLAKLLQRAAAGGA